CLGLHFAAFEGDRRGTAFGSIEHPPSRRLLVLIARYGDQTLRIVKKSGRVKRAWTARKHSGARHDDCRRPSHDSSTLPWAPDRPDGIQHSKERFTVLFDPPAQGRLQKPRKARVDLASPAHHTIHVDGELWNLLQELSAEKDQDHFLSTSDCKGRDENLATLS